MLSVAPPTATGSPGGDGGDSVYATTGGERQRNSKRLASPNYGDGANHAYDRLHPPRTAVVGSPPRRQATDPLPHPCVFRSPSRSPSSTVPGIPAAVDTPPAGTSPVLRPLSNEIGLRPNDAYHYAEMGNVVGSNQMYEDPGASAQGPHAGNAYGSLMPTYGQATPDAGGRPADPEYTHLDRGGAPESSMDARPAADHAIAPRVTRARYVETTARHRWQDAQEEPDVLTQQPYFHGAIDRTEAECRLRQFCDTDPGAHANPDGRFLVREKRPDGPGTRTSYVMTVVFRCDRSRRIMVEHHVAERARRTDGGQGNHFIVDGKIRISGHRSMVSLVAELIADPNAAHAAVISGRSKPLLSTACPKPPPL